MIEDHQLSDLLSMKKRGDTVPPSRLQDQKKATPMPPHTIRNSSVESPPQRVSPSSRRQGLRRTGLAATRKVELAAAALGRTDEFGAKTELAQQYEVSRPTVYSAELIASGVLTQHFESATSVDHWTAVDDAQIRRTVVALRVVAPNSLRSIETLLPLLYPGVKCSYGKIQQIVTEAEKRAEAWNARANLAGISAGALDEMFSQGTPVLAGVDLESGYLFALEMRESRGREDWSAVLEAGKAQGLNLEVAVKDAALGIEAGVREVFPHAEQRDDCFHAHYEMGKVRRVLEQRAYGAIAAEERARQKLEELRRTGRGETRRALVNRFCTAKRHCTPKLHLHDEFERAMVEVQEAMELVDLEGGRLRTADECQMAIESAARRMAQLDDRKCKTVGRYIENRAPGLVKYIAAMREQLAVLVEHYSLPLVVLACTVTRLASELQRGRRRGTRTKSGDTTHLMGALGLLRARVGDKGEALLAKVQGIFERRHRASSAIEGFNAALRPFLYVHKGVSKGFLQLFRAYYNLRNRRWGRHKGTSAHECLAGDGVGDWLSVLGYPPSAGLH